MQQLAGLLQEGKKSRKTRVISGGFATEGIAYCTVFKKKSSFVFSQNIFLKSISICSGILVHLSKLKRPHTASDYFGEGLT